MDIAKKWNRLAFRLTAGVFLVLLTLFSLWIIRFQPPASNSASSPPPPPTAEMRKVEETAKAHTQEEFKELLPQPGETNAETVERGLDTAQQQAASRTHEENLSELERKSAQLSRYATAESVEQISEKMAAWTGTAPRATAPLENPPPGEVDLDTAQLHDVLRTGSPEEGYHYTGILFDAEGRSIHVEMDASEGKKAWETMQMVKKNPLMETVYRAMVIPLMDKRMKK